MTWAPEPDVRNFAQQVIHAANNLFIADAVFGTRITSYNVCYTKLLRIAVGNEQVPAGRETG